MDALLASISLVPCHIERKGAPRFTGSRKIATFSGFNVVVSEAPGSDVQSQIRDALAFVKANCIDIQRAVQFPGVERAYLDFGIHCRLNNEVAAQYDYYPPDLLRLAGELGLGIEISLYPAETDNQGQA